MQAFVLRVAPSDIDRVPEALDTNQIIIGWARAEGLLNPNLSYEQFREIIRSEYYPSDSTLRRSGQAAGHMWRFIRDMETDDLVVVPYDSNFYVAKILDDEAIFIKEKQSEDSAYRRSVQWLNEKNAIPRSYAKSALIARMKIHGTSASATDLLDDIRECLDLAQEGKEPSFRDDLQTRLVKETLIELREGRLDPYAFENLIKGLLANLGAKKAEVIPRNKDQGADIVATFRVADTIPMIVAVQAKHWKPEPPVDESTVNQLISGIEAESADLGMVITAGSFSKEAELAAQVYFEQTGKRIELVDGEQFAKMLIEHGTKGN